MMSLGRVFLIGLLPVLLAACETAQTTTTVPLVSENDPVLLKLAEASQKASKALDDIAQVQKINAPPIVADDFSDAPQELQQAVTVKWSGPVEKIVQALADKAGYRFNIVGRAPPVPVIATVDVYQKPLIKVLHDIGLQLGDRADLALDTSKSLIEVHYVAPDFKG